MKEKKEREKSSTCLKILSPIYTNSVYRLLSLLFCNLFMFVLRTILEVLLNSFRICSIAIDLKEFRAACLLSVLEIV